MNKFYSYIICHYHFQKLPTQVIICNFGYSTEKQTLSVFTFRQ